MALSNKKPTLLIGPLPPPTTGLTTMFSIIVKGFQERQLPYYITNLSTSEQTRCRGTFSWRRAQELIKAFGCYLTCLPRAGNVYMLVAFSTWGFFRDFLMLWIARLLKRQIVIHVHSGGYGDFYQAQPGWLRFVIRITLAQAAQIVVLGDLLKEQFYFIPEARDRIRIVPNGLSISTDYKLPVEKVLPDSGSLRLLYLSNMIKSKGYLDVLAACCLLLRSSLVPFKCDFCGDFVSTTMDHYRTPPEAERANFLHLLKAWQLEDVVEYHGVVFGEEKYRLLNETHLLILPTYYPWEGQPACIIEAMAFGTPVIATPHRGIPEQIRAGYNGLFVPPEDPDSIASAIESIWRDRNFYSYMSRNAYLHYQENFTAQKHLDRLIPLLTGNQLV